LSETPNDPAQDGKGITAADSQVKAMTHTVEPPPVAGPWARLKEHRVVQWTLAYAAFAFALLAIPRPQIAGQRKVLTSGIAREQEAV
jgi:hypothetical protein